MLTVADDGRGEKVDLTCGSGLAGLSSGRRRRRQLDDHQPARRADQHVTVEMPLHA